MKPELSVVIPAYNRPEALEFTLKNLAKALQNIDHELIIVDDGSEPSLKECVPFPPSLNCFFLEQKNQGSAVARSKGILNSKGRFIFLTDSDDMIEPLKLKDHLELMKKTPCIISYSDQGLAKVSDSFQNVEVFDKIAMPSSTPLHQLLIESDLCSNNLVFDGKVLRQAIENPLIEPDHRFALAGDYWVYYNLLRFDGTAEKVKDVYCYHCQHGDQVTSHWEPLGFSGQALCESLIDKLERVANRDGVEESLSRIIMKSYRKLPNQFHQGFEDRKIRSWKQLPKLENSEYGGKLFCALAYLFGPIKAAKTLRLIQRPGYDEIPTIDQELLHQSYKKHFPDSAL